MTSESLLEEPGRVREKSPARTLSEALAVLTKHAIRLGRTGGVNSGLVL